jgi:hypothetical protein
MCGHFQRHGFEREDTAIGVWVCVLEFVEEKEVVFEVVDFIACC